ncbi:MAG: SAM-dependent methyltransferase [Actinomadura sp.]
MGVPVLRLVVLALLGRWPVSVRVRCGDAVADAGEERQRAAGIDVTVPSVARIYDYLLSGKDNFAVDREVFRNREAVGRFFNGFELVDPGLVGATNWRSDHLEHAQPGGEWILAGVGRKP